MVNAYTKYADWKEWDDKFTWNSEDNAIFTQEFRDINLNGCNLLEIGFGNCSLLAWAKNQGASLYGSEIQKELVAKAAANEVEIVSTNLADITESHSNFFDVVAAFDVLEHLDKVTIQKYIKYIHQLLSKNGYLVARFPNSQSPFGLQYQHGDFTHTTNLSISAFTQLAQLNGFKVIRAGNAARPYSSSTTSNIKRRVIYSARNILEYTIGSLYFGCRIPLDPNVTIVLKKTTT